MALLLIGRSTLLTLALGSAGLAIFVPLRRAVSGTTLLAAWWWGLVSFLLVVAALVDLTVVGPAPNDLHQALFLVALASTFCPGMAMLGAKRPQQRAWQWIVLSLWLVLALPAGEWLLFAPRHEMHPARSWFMAALVALAPLNYLPTRHWLAGLLFAAGQSVLLAPFLPLVSQAPWPALPPELGLSLIVAGLAVAAWWPASPLPAEPLDRLWEDFRTLFGAVWALRVAERVNAVAGQNGWSTRLTWSGFRTNEDCGAGSIPAEIRGPLAKTLRSLLLSFTSPPWIESRLDPADGGQPQ